MYKDGHDRPSSFNQKSLVHMTNPGINVTRKTTRILGNYIAWIQTNNVFNPYHIYNDIEREATH